jgi:cellulose biosynthesis protein BcsE
VQFIGTEAFLAARAWSSTFFWPGFRFFREWNLDYRVGLNVTDCGCWPEPDFWFTWWRRRRLLQTTGVNIMNHSSMTPMTGIGIQGLPNLTANMLSGGLYVLIAELPSARFPLLAGGLGSALNADQICNVIVPANPELFIRRVESFDCFNASELMAANRLNFYVMQDEFPKKMFRFGADSFVKELEQFEIPENSYLLFDQADELLSLHDISMALDQIDILRKWFQLRKVTALLVFSRSTAEQSGTINALMDHLTGIARLSGDRDGLEITFDYWQSSEGTVTAKNYPLLTLDSGLYEATTRIVPSKVMVDEEKYERIADADSLEPRYFYMDPDLDSLAGEMVGVWQRVDTSIGMMHATRNTRSATCILSFDGDTDLQQLAETVHTLRVSLGRYALIVVREKDASLGHQSEALLLRLGINLVVHRDVSKARMPTLLESLLGQVFKRDIEVSFEAAVESAFPPLQRSDLPAQTFAQEVNAALDRAQTLGLPCAMVTGKPMPGRTVVELLTRSTFARPGDIMTSDGVSCYIFLYACPQSEILATLEKIIGLAVEVAFDDPKLFIHLEEIQPELAVLLREAEHGNLPKSPPKSGLPRPKVHTVPLAPAEPALFTSITSSANNADAAGNAPLKSAISSQIKAKHEQPSTAVQITQTTPVALVNSAANAPPLSEPRARAAVSSRLSDLPSEEAVFSYDGASNAPAFGKKEAPRATRKVAS